MDNNTPVFTTDEINRLGEKADILNQFVGLYHDFSIEKKDYGTGEYVCMADSHMLMRIVNKPGVTVSELAEQTNRTKSFISQTVKKLISMGFVTREASKEDARVARLYPTEKGLALNSAHLLYDAAEVDETFKELQQYCSIDDIEAFFRVVIAYCKILLE